MLDTKLKKYIAEANAVETGRTLSDDAVEALMEIHLSVAGLAAVGGESGYINGDNGYISGESKYINGDVGSANGKSESSRRDTGSTSGESVSCRGEAWYGSAAFHHKSMEKLFGLCLRRCRSGSSLERRSRLVPVLYNIFHMPDSAFDVRRDMMVGRRACRAIEEWLSKAGDSSRPFPEEERRTEYGILNCIIESMRYAADEDKLENPAFQYMRDRVKTWAEELNADGSWEGIGTGEALQRIDVMIGNSNVHGDTRFDALIVKARNRCFERIIGCGSKTVPAMASTSDTTDTAYTTNHASTTCSAIKAGVADMTVAEAVTATTLNACDVFMLYRTLMWGIGPADWNRAETVAKVAAMQLEACPQGSDCRLWSLAVLIDLTCMKINEAVKRRTLAQSA